MQLRQKGISNTISVYYIVYGSFCSSFIHPHNLKNMKLPSALTITLLYVALGLLWIHYSDEWVNNIAGGDALLAHKLQEYKGYFFIAMTGVLLYILVSSHDAVLEKQLKALSRSEQQYRALFEASPMPIFIYNADTGHIIQANDAAVQLYKYSTQELAGMSIWQIVGPEGMAAVDERLDIQPGKDEHVRGIRRHTRKDGELLYAFTQDIPFDVDAMHTRVLIANDITRQMLYIEAIEKQNEKLNRISFAQSHKVRSPLASIMGLTNLLNETTINTEDYSTILSKLTEACTKLDNVIREIDSDARPQAV